MTRSKSARLVEQLGAHLGRAAHDQAVGGGQGTDLHLPRLLGRQFQLQAPAATGGNHPHRLPGASRFQLQDHALQIAVTGIGQPHREDLCLAENHLARTINVQVKLWLDHANGGAEHQRPH